MTNPKQEIRVDIKVPAKSPELLEQLCRIENACFSSPWTEEMLSASLDSKYILTLTAECENAVAGYAMAAFSGKEADILNIAVLPEHRKKGIGRALLQMLLWHLRHMGAESVYLEVRALNEEAKALYLSEGFCICGYRKNYYSNPKEDALVMSFNFS